MEQSYACLSTSGGTYSR